MWPFGLGTVRAHSGEGERQAGQTEVKKSKETGPKKILKKKRRKGLAAHKRPKEKKRSRKSKVIQGTKDSLLKSQ